MAYYLDFVEIFWEIMFWKFISGNSGSRLNNLKNYLCKIADIEEEYTPIEFDFV